MANNNGYVIASLTPGWIKKRVPDNYADDVLKDLIMFYVINTPCDDLSSSGIKLTEYGWGKDVWKNDRLKNYLFSIAGLERNSSFAVASKTDEMKAICEGRYNEFLSICYHIRNAFAHGRLAMYGYKNGSDIVFALEDGVKKKGKFEVRSCMILKKSTLKKWMEILKSGRYPDMKDTKK